MITQQNLNATIPVSFLSSFNVNDIVYFPIDVVRGQFEHLANPGVILTEFTQGQVNQGQITFIHSGVNAAPAYNIFASPFLSSPIISPMQSANISYNAKPILVNNNLIIQEGQTVTLTSQGLLATDNTDDPAGLLFQVQNVQNGFCQFASNPGVAITNFFQADITAQKVQFVADGTENIPFYSVSISDGKVVTPAVFVNTIFTKINDAPVLEKNQLVVNRKRATILTANDLQAHDEETNANELIFYLTEIKNGYFFQITQPLRVVTIFPQSDILIQNIQFNFDGGSALPSYKVSVSDGLAFNSAIAATVQFNTNEDSSLTITSKSNTIRNAIIGGAISGGLGLIFLAIKLTISYVAAKHLKRALEEDKPGLDEERAAYYKHVVQPMVKKVFEQIKIKGFLGSLGVNRLNQYMDAVQIVLLRIEQGGVDLDLPNMTLLKQNIVLSAVAKATREVLVEEVSCCSTTRCMRFFKADASPDAIQDAATEIAQVVKDKLSQYLPDEIITHNALSGDSDNSGIELTTVNLPDPEQVPSATTPAAVLERLKRSEDRMDQLETMLFSRRNNSGKKNRRESGAASSRRGDNRIRPESTTGNGLKLGR